jgi:hypothetical protein
MCDGRSRVERNNPIHSNVVRPRFPEIRRLVPTVTAENLKSAEPIIDKPVAQSNAGTEIKVTGTKIKRGGKRNGAGRKLSGKAMTAAERKAKWKAKQKTDA